MPGVGNVQAERIALAQNVREYVGFYSRDERSKGFACVIPTVASGTQICIYPMPGRHATLVGNASVDGAGDGKVLKEPAYRSPFRRSLPDPLGCSTGQATGLG